MTQLGDDIARSALELARSLWAELGVTDVPSRHDWQAIDLEPLIIFTACCASGDQRLRAKTIEWCANNDRNLSAFRLRHFSRLVHPSTRRAAERYVAAVDAASRKAKINQRSRTVGVGARASRAAPDLRRPALIQLRLRAVVGVSARAEVLKLMLAEPTVARTSSSMVARAGYGKGGVAQALEMLTAAGITTVEMSGNRLLYRLSRPSELAQALNGLPASFPDWGAIFRVTEGALRYARTAPRDPPDRVAAAAALTRELAQDIQRIAPGVRPPRITGPGSIAGFDRWARTFVAEQAGAGTSFQPGRGVMYTVHRLLLGGWIATVREPGDQPRPLALSESNPLETRSHGVRLDEISAAADVIESMLLDMRTRDLQRSQGSVVRRQSLTDSLLPALSRDFASELLHPMHKGQSATYTEEFLRRWFLNHRHHLTASA